MPVSLLKGSCLSRFDAENLTDSCPLPVLRQFEGLVGFVYWWQWLLLLDLALLFELLALGLDGFEEFGGGTVLGQLLGEFAADCGLQDRAFDCLCELAV